MNRIQKIADGIFTSSLVDKSSKKLIKTASSTAYQNGLISVSKTYGGMLVPMARYTLTNVINSNPPKIATNSGMDKRVGLVDTQTDVNITVPAMDSLMAFYDDKIISAYTKYGDFIVTAKAKNRESAKAWMDNFDRDMVTKNQYRGKCLFAEKESMFFKEIPETNWEDVVLKEAVKKDIMMNAISFFANDKLHKQGINKREIMMHGPPGTGKTSVVKATFKALEGRKVSRIYVTAESFKHMPVGHVFDLLSYLGPTVLAFEDIDMVGTNRNITASSNLLGDLLTNLDGMRKNREPLVVMASTNKIDMLDEALSCRPGRFSRKIEIGLPDDNHLQMLYGKLMNASVDDEVIKMSNKFTGSHVVETVSTARILAAELDTDPMDSLREACQIIRDNFFPGEDNSGVKIAVQAHIVKKANRKFNFRK